MYQALLLLLQSQLWQSKKFKVIQWNMNEERWLSGENIVSSTSGAEKTGYTHVIKMNLGFLC